MKSFPGSLVVLVTAAAALALLACVYFLWIDRGTDAEMGSGNAAPRSSGEPVPERKSDFVSTDDERVRLPAASITIKGRVIDSDERAIADIDCRMIAASGEALESQTTGDDGAFVLAASPSDESVTLLLRGEGWFPRAIELPALDRPEIDLGAQTLQPAGTIGLTVTVANGHTVPEVTVELLDEKGNDYGMSETFTAPVRAALGKSSKVVPFDLMEMPETLEGGTLRFQVPAGKWRVRLAAEGYSPVESGFVTVVHGETAWIALEFLATGSISGICVDVHGLPQGGLDIAAFPGQLDDNQDGSIDIFSDTRIKTDNGTTLSPTRRTKTHDDGFYCFDSLPLSSWFEIWCTDDKAKTIEIRSSDLIDDSIVPVGTDDAEIVVRLSPRLILTLTDESGNDPGPGTGHLYCSIWSDNSGKSDHQTLTETKTNIPIPLPHRFEKGGEALIHLSVIWNHDSIGELDLTLPWGTDILHGTVILKSGILFDLGSFPYDLNYASTWWFCNGEEDRSSISRFSGDTMTLPRWRDYYDFESNNVRYVLLRNPDSNHLQIISDSGRLWWATIWGSKYQRLAILNYDTESEAPRLISRKLFNTAENIVLELDPNAGFVAGDRMVGHVRAFAPGLFEGKPIAYWNFYIDPEPGSMPRQSRGMAVQYKPAPGASVTLTRPTGLEYTVRVTIRKEGSNLKPLTDRFLLDGPKVFTITAD